MRARLVFPADEVFNSAAAPTLPAASVAGCCPIVSQTLYTAGKILGYCTLGERAQKQVEQKNQVPLLQERRQISATVRAKAVTREGQKLLVRLGYSRCRFCTPTGMYMSGEMLTWRPPRRLRRAKRHGLIVVVRPSSRVRDWGRRGWGS